MKWTPAYKIELKMVAKEELHLGQRVLAGAEKKEGIIDALTQTFAGVIILGGGYEFCRYKEIEV